MKSVPTVFVRVLALVCFGGSSPVVASAAQGVEAFGKMDSIYSEFRDLMYPGSYLTFAMVDVGEGGVRYILGFESDAPEPMVLAHYATLLKREPKVEASTNRCVVEQGIINAPGHLTVSTGDKTGGGTAICIRTRRAMTPAEGSALSSYEDDPRLVVPGAERKSVRVSRMITMGSACCPQSSVSSSYAVAQTSAEVIEWYSTHLSDARFDVRYKGQNGNGPPRYEDTFSGTLHRPDGDHGYSVGIARGSLPTGIRIDYRLDENGSYFDSLNATVPEMLLAPPKEFSSAAYSYALKMIASRDASAPPELWKLFEKAMRIERTESSFASRSLSLAIAAVGSEADIEKLKCYYFSEKSEFTRTNTVLYPLGTLFIRNELAKIKASNRPRLHALSLPAGSSAAQPTGDAGVRMASALRACYRTYVSNSQPKVELSAKGMDMMLGEIGRILNNDTGANAITLAKYYRSGWCGSFDDILYGPRYMASFISLIREKRYHEALGVLLCFDSRQNYLSPEAQKAEFEWRKEFAEFCGYDAEVLYRAIGQWNQFHGLKG